MISGKDCGTDRVYLDEYEINGQIKKWAENEFDGIAEYGGVISVKVSTAPAA